MLFSISCFYLYTFSFLIIFTCSISRPTSRSRVYIDIEFVQNGFVQQRVCAQNVPSYPILKDDYQHRRHHRGKFFSLSTPILYTSRRRPTQRPSYINLAEAEAVTTQPNIAQPLYPTTTDLPSTPTASKDPLKEKVSDPTRLKLTMPATRLPPSPEPTPDHQLTRGTKRAAPAEHDSPSFGRAAKRLAITSPSTATYNAFIAKLKAAVEGTHTPNTPMGSISRDSVYCLNPEYTIVQGLNGPIKIYKDKICALELRRLAEEVLYQVDWEGLEENIACNRPWFVYRRVVLRMLLEKADELEVEEKDEESHSESEIEKEKVEESDSNVEDEDEEEELESGMGSDEYVEEWLQGSSQGNFDGAV